MDAPGSSSRAANESFTNALRDVGEWFSGLGEVLGLPSRRASAAGPSVRSASRLGGNGDGGRPSSAGLDGGKGRAPPVDLPVPSTSILSGKQQIVAGMLLKYVSLGAGWRHRLFVLQDGVLRYHKVYGPAKVNVHMLLEMLRQQGELFLIGAEISMLEGRDRRALEAGGLASAGSIASSGTSQGGGPALTRAATTYRRMPAPQAELHLQVCTIRESQADYRKFYVHTGNKQVMPLRAETKEDRWVWVEALRAAKGAWEGVTPVEAGALRRAGSDRVRTQDDDFLASLEQMRQRMVARGIDAETQKWVEDLLVQEHQRLHEVMLAEETKRRTLLGIIYQLENDKRELETAMVVEGGRSGALRARAAVAGSRPGGTPRAGSGGGLLALSAESLDVEESAVSEEDRQESVGYAEDEPTDDEFYECESASVTSAHSRQLSGDITAMAAALGAGGSAGGSTAATPVSTPSAAGGILAAAAAAAQQQQQQQQLAAQPAWLTAEGPAPPRRTRLPPPAQQERSVSLWSLIKEMVGKDLTRVCLPVYFNEPLSALQKTAEDLEYSQLLDAAAACAPGSIERLLNVAAFAVSAYSSTPSRTAKPFNPLLGETYEFVCQEKGFRFLAEKVSHHPTIIAARAEGCAWVYEGDAEVKSKFWGRSIEMHPEGLLCCTFADGEQYAWNKVVTSINNLILGKIYIDHGGIMKVRNVATGLTARIRFKETGMIFDRDPRQVRGYLEQGSQRLDRPLLHGHWDDALYADMPDGSTVQLWAKAPPPPDPTRYNLTAFAIELNEVTPGLETQLAPTDCRLRPDQHALELGQYDVANAEKQRLEHKQRAARKAAERGEPIRPRWFEVLDPEAAAGGKAPGSPQKRRSLLHHGSFGHGQGHQPGEQLRFKYRGGYWEERAAGRYTGCRDIFGPDVVPTEV